MAVQKRLNSQFAEHGTPGTVYVYGNFTTNNTSDPTTYSSGPFSIVYAATGKYTITFKEPMVEILSVHCSLEDATGSAKRVIPITGKTAGTATTNAAIVLETQSVAGTAAALTGPIVHFWVAFRKGRLTK